MIGLIFRLLALLVALVLVLGGGLCLMVAGPKSSDVFWLTLIFFVPGGLLFWLALGGIKSRKDQPIDAHSDTGTNGYIGKYFVITVSTEDQNNGPLQIHGYAEDFTPNGLQIGLRGKCSGKTWTVPISAIRPADPGTYTLESSGEVVTNPDYFAHISAKPSAHHKLASDDVSGNP